MCQNVNKGNCVVRVLRHLEDTQYVPPPPGPKTVCLLHVHTVLCVCLFVCVSLSKTMFLYAVTFSHYILCLFWLSFPLKCSINVKS